MNKMKIGIIGAGAIGCFVGARLLKNNADIYFLGRDRLGKKILETGLKITDLDSIDTYIEPGQIHWLNNPQELPMLDVALVTTKSQDTLSAINSILTFLKKEAVIVSLQNGTSNPKTLREILPNHKIITGMVPFNVIEVNSRAYFKQTTKGQICLNEHLNCLQALNYRVIEDIESIQWGKLIKNLNSALNALSNRALLDQLMDRNERRLLSKVVTEALRVLGSSSINAKNNSPIPIRLFPHVLKLPTRLFKIVSSVELKMDPDARLSMWQDLELGRKTEIEYLNGEIVNLAQKKGINVPTNKKVVELINLAESGQLALARTEYKKLIQSQ